MSEPTPEVVTPTPPPESGVPAESVAQAQGSAGMIDVATVQDMIDQALARQRKEFDQEVRQVAGGSPLAPHSAGVGDSVYPSWGQYEQSLAAAGTHPDQADD